MKLTTNFQVEEFVPKEVYDQWGDESADFINPQLAPTCQSIKDELTKHIGKPVVVTVCNWLWGGGYNESGLRAPEAVKRYRAKLGKHFFGCAADLKFKGCAMMDAFNFIERNQSKFPYIIRIENPNFTRSVYGTQGNDWLHIEVTSKPRMGEIKVFNP